VQVYAGDILWKIKMSKYESAMKLMKDYRGNGKEESI
jgi:hypothetical protein